MFNAIYSPIQNYLLSSIKSDRLLVELKKKNQKIDENFDEGFGSDGFGDDEQEVELSRDDMGFTHIDLDVRQIPFMKLMELVLEIYNLDMTITDKEILIVPPKPLEIWQEYSFKGLSKGEWESLVFFTPIFLRAYHESPQNNRLLKVDEAKQSFRIKAWYEDHLWLKKVLLEGYRQELSLNLYEKGSDYHLPYNRAELEKNEADQYGFMTELKLNLLMNKPLKWQGVEWVYDITGQGEYVLRVQTQTEQCLKLSYGRELIVPLSDKRFVLIRNGGTK